MCVENPKIHEKYTGRAWSSSIYAQPKHAREGNIVTMLGPKEENSESKEKHVEETCR